MKTRYSSEILWSSLSNVPIFVYDEEYDFHICFWNGHIISKSCAIVIISKLYLDISPSEQQQIVVMKDMLKLYKIFNMKFKSEFEPHVHNTIITEIMSDISSNDENFFANLINHYDFKHALRWLIKSRDKVYNEV